MQKTVRLYKFSRAEHSLDNLRKRRVKVSTLDDLNDPFEFQPFRLPTKEYRKAWSKIRQQLWKEKGIISFSKSWNNPVIWSHYADGHKGLALGFDIDSNLLADVSYRKTRMLAPRILDLPIGEALSHVSRAMRTKYEHWVYEEEARLFASCKERDSNTGLFFKEFDDALVPKEVIIGARSDVGSADIRKATEGLEDITITTTRLAFKTFRVVRQRKEILQK